jgi:3-oxoadipate enol-lactonase
VPKIKLKDSSLNYEIDDFTDPWSENKSVAVVFHHGIGRNLNFWYRWVPVVARKYKVIRFDARGFGQSSDPGPDFIPTIPGLANDVVALMDRLGISQIHFIGEGIGSFVGFQLAIDHPQRVKTLLVSAEAPYASLPSKGSLERRLETIDSGGLKAYVSGNMQQRVGNVKALGKWWVEETVKSRTHVVKAALRAVNDIDYRGQISKVKSPVLGIFGEVSIREWDADGKTLALMKDRLPASSEFVVIKGAPLFVVYTRPEMCARLALKFFKKQG